MELWLFCSVVNFVPHLYKYFCYSLTSILKKLGYVNCTEVLEQTTKEQDMEVNHKCALHDPILQLFISCI
jgi:hypothetical protein